MGKKREHSAATPDTEDQDISHADRGGTRSLTGTMHSVEPQTAKGTSPGSVYQKIVGVIPAAGKTVPKSGKQKPANE